MAIRSTNHPFSVFSFDKEKDRYKIFYIFVFNVGINGTNGCDPLWYYYGAWKPAARSTFLNKRFSNIDSGLDGSFAVVEQDFLFLKPEIYQACREIYKQLQESFSMDDW